MKLNNILKLALLVCLPPVPGIGSEFALPAGVLSGAEAPAVPAVPEPGSDRAVLPPVVINAAFNGRTILLRVGQELRVDVGNVQAATGAEFDRSRLVLLSAPCAGNSAALGGAALAAGVLGMVNSPTACGSSFLYRLAGIAPGATPLVIRAGRPGSPGAVELIRVRVEVAASRAAAPAVSLTQASSGATVRLRPGQGLMISLGGQYNDETLQPVYDARVVRYLGMSFSDDSPMGWTDDYQVREFKFAAAGKGRTTVLLQVRRPWSPRPETVYTVNVIVD